MEFVLREALAYESAAFDQDTEIEGADMVQWFAEWRERAKQALGLWP